MSRSVSEAQQDRPVDAVPYARAFADMVHVQAVRVLIAELVASATARAERLSVERFTEMVGMDAKRFARVALRRACADGDGDAVAWLCQRFRLTAADVRWKNNDALRCACENGHAGVAQYLCAAYQLTAADARARGNHALSAACQNGHLDTVEWLATLGLAADDARSCGALGAACWNGHLAVARFLVARFGLDVRRDLGTDAQALVGGDHPETVAWLNSQLRQ